MNLVNSLLGATALQIEFLFGGLALALCLVWFVIWILVAVWVYRDAESRGMGGALWLIIVILLGLIGLIVYIVVRSDKPVLGMQPGYQQYQQQPYQQQYQQPPPQQYQPPQQPPPGQQPPPSQRFCQRCGTAVQPGMQFCQSCGNRL